MSKLTALAQHLGLKYETVEEIVSVPDASPRR